MFMVDADILFRCRCQEQQLALHSLSVKKRDERVENSNEKLTSDGRLAVVIEVIGID